MTKDPDSTECPVCGRSVPSDAVTCPSCGADLSMSSLEELERVARSLSSGDPMPAEPPKAVVETEKPPEARVETKSVKEPPKETEEPVPKEEGKRLGKLFGRRKK